MLISTAIRARSLMRTAALASALCSSTFLAPLSSLAQDAHGVVVHAATELNLRKGSGNTDANFVTVPAGAALRLAPAEATNEYIPVPYNGIQGWVLEIGVALPAGADTSGDVIQEPDNALSL
jgi:uncharacterized protein YraI